MACELGIAWPYPQRQKSLSYGMDTHNSANHARLHGGGVYRPARWQLRRGMA
jgi:hypothetical protein